MEVVNEVLHNIPLNDIWADDEFNSRGYISPGSVSELADDILRNGVKQPPVLQRVLNEARGTKFKIIMGHRRFEAVKLLRRQLPGDPKWATIQCRVLERALPEHEALIMNLKENLERAPLNPLQEALALKRFRQWGWDAKQVAKELGQTKKWVEIRFGLLLLPPEIQQRAAANYLTQYQIQECIELASTEEQIEYVRRIVDHKLRGEKLPKESREEAKRRRNSLSVMTKGEPRTLAEMALVQESIQDSFRDVKHPAAIALAWAAGIISYEEFVVRHIEDWIEKENDVRVAAGQVPIEFKHNEQLAKVQAESGKTQAELSADEREAEDETGDPRPEY